MGNAPRYTAYRIACLVVAAGALLSAAACTSAVPTETPGVERLGDYILREKAAEVEVVLGYRFGSMSLGNEWLILEVAASSPNGKTAKIERDKVFVRTPDGVRIPLATQRAFNEAYSTMRNTIAQANVARDPMDYFPPNRDDCSFDMFVAPGEGVAFDQVTVNDRRACQGKLFFQVPGGIQPGRWVLEIDVGESEVRIPFDLKAE